MYDSSHDKEKGLFFLDFGWQVSMSGAQAEPFIDGELSKGVTAIWEKYVCVINFPKISI